MIRFICRPLLLIALGVMFIAAAQLDMDDYWLSPSASHQINHDWSALEKNMRPEACAQCHESQFNDWKKSLHADAFSPGLVGQFSHMGSGEEVNACLRCHAPLDEQLYRSEQDMLQSLKLLKQHPQGFDKNADLTSPQANLPLRHAGVSCAVCHVRDGQRFGPPKKGDEQQGLIKAEAHGGFVASSTFEKSNFCAECHQFPHSYAINGKPLENTVKEWQQSRFAAEGKQCQGCHMPDRKHVFKGIHDKAFTRQGLFIKTSQKQGSVTLKIISQAIGHAFPTYVTPKVVVRAEALDAQGESLQTWTWDIVREVYYDNGWLEKRDTRLMPGETREFVVNDLIKGTKKVHFSIDVMPDTFYKGVYMSLIEGDLTKDAEVLIRRALNTAKTRDYRLYSEFLIIK